MSLSRHQQIFTQNVAKLILKANSMGINLTFGEAYRTKDQQYLYFHGKKFEEDKLVDTKRRSWIMNSNHLRRLAVDFNFFIKGQLIYDRTNPLILKLGQYWESLDSANRWGGYWMKPDSDHFEMNVK